MADLDQFISVVTDEAMQKICYATADAGSGWKIKPYKFGVSDTDPLAGYSEEQIFDENGRPRPEIIQLLREFTTAQMSMDSTHTWCSLPFSGLTKPHADSPTISHHVVVPANYFPQDVVKQIKTIYFIYIDQFNNPFLYALARATNYLVYETGVTQNFVFNFTVTNEHALDVTDFIINYSYPFEIEDHNEAENSHIHLLARDGSRSAIDLLSYQYPRREITLDNQIVDKKYVDDVLGGMGKALETLPGTLMDWPGTTPPAGWAVRNGQLLSIADNPRLYAILGQRYKDEAIISGYDTTKQFPLMNDSGLFIRSAEVGANGQIVNNNYLSGTAFGMKQGSTGPNIRGIAGMSWASGSQWNKGTIEGVTQITGCFYKIPNGEAGVKYYGVNDASTSNNDPGMGFDASRSSSLYSNNAKEFRPNSRNYLPIIKLG